VKDWRTTLAGLAAAILHVSINGVSWKQLAYAGLLAAVGYLAKDHNQ